MSDLKKAEAIVAQLEQKRIKCIARGTELADERANVALAAHTGDAVARKKLDSLNRESAEHASELQSLDAPLLAASPPPWSVEEQSARFCVRDHNGQALAYV
jgi:rubrerythrin